MIIASDTFLLEVISGLDPTIETTATGTTVAGVTVAVGISGDQSRSGLVGSRVVYTFTVTNLGDYTDHFTLIASGDWNCGLSTAQTPDLEPMETYQVLLWVDVPASAVDQAVGVINLQAISGLDNDISIQATAHTTAQWLRIYLSMIKYRMISMQYLYHREDLNFGLR